MKLEAITAYIQAHIPITTALGVRVEHWDGQSVIIAAPLQPNLNHRNTAYGGSLSAVAILSGWTLAFLKLKDAGIRSRLVIQKSTMDFEEPVASDFRAIARMPDEAVWERFLQTLRRHGRARITIDAVIETAAGIGGSHAGVYVAVRPSV